VTSRRRGSGRRGVFAARSGNCASFLKIRVARRDQPASSDGPVAVHHLPRRRQSPRGALDAMGTSEGALRAPDGRVVHQGGINDPVSPAVPARPTRPPASSPTISRRPRLADVKHILPALSAVDRAPRNVHLGRRAAAQSLLRRRPSSTAVRATAGETPQSPKGDTAICSMPTGSRACTSVGVHRATGRIVVVDQHTSLDPQNEDDLIAFIREKGSRL
jgi:hypothetical protein